MKKTKTAKAFAIFALLGIIVSIVGTWILVLTSPSHTQQPTLNQEQIDKILEESNINIETSVESLDWVKVEADTINVDATQVEDLDNIEPEIAQ